VGAMPGSRDGGIVLRADAPDGNRDDGKRVAAGTNIVKAAGARALPVRERIEN
jgi:hypothetical protein